MRSVVRGAIYSALRRIGAGLGVRDIADRQDKMAHEIKALRHMVARLQFHTAATPDGLPLPPPHLHLLVSGNEELDTQDYWEIGINCAHQLAELARAYGAPIETMGAILDFGCGCARMTRHWRGLPRTDVHGTDYNPTLIDWCRRNLPFAHFGLNQLEPPLDYADEMFDLIYSYSVFTHLPEALQCPWIVELGRVLKPGGRLLFTTHGEAFARRYLPAKEAQEFAAGRLVVQRPNVAGTNECAAYHPMSYVRGRLTAGFEILHVITGEVMDGERRIIGQDVWLLRKPVNGRRGEAVLKGEGVADPASRPRGDR